MIAHIVRGGGSTAGATPVQTVGIPNIRRGTTGAQGGGMLLYGALEGVVSPVSQPMDPVLKM